MSRILYILAANYNWNHLENSKIGLENSWKSTAFFLQMSGNPAVAYCSLKFIAFCKNNS